MAVALISSFASKRPLNYGYNTRLVPSNLSSFRKRYFMLIIGSRVNVRVIWSGVCAASGTSSVVHRSSMSSILLARLAIASAC
jgi:hypothetical protein